jgi:hypothetical protein
VECIGIEVVALFKALNPAFHGLYNFLLRVETKSGLNSQNGGMDLAVARTPTKPNAIRFASPARQTHGGEA